MFTSSQIAALAAFVLPALASPVDIVKRDGFSIDQVAGAQVPKFGTYLSDLAIYHLFSSIPISRSHINAPRTRHRSSVPSFPRTDPCSLEYHDICDFDFYIRSCLRLLGAYPILMLTHPSSRPGRHGQDLQEVWQDRS